MNKVWIIAWNTFRSRVRSGSFLFLTLGMPVLMIVAVLFSVSSALGSTDIEALGYIDQTGQLTGVSQAEFDEDKMLSMIRYPDAEEAAGALNGGTIAGYILIPEGYFEGEQVIYYGEEAPGEILRLALVNFIRRSLLADESALIIDRIEDPAEVTYVALDSGAEVTEGAGLVIRIAAPIGLALVFSLAVMFTTGQMGAAVVREKEQRAMEIIITSLRPTELVAGKVLGMSMLVLAQLSIWTIGGLAALFLALQGGVELPNLSIPWNALLWGGALIIPGYLLFAVLGAGLGIIAGDSQQAQQLASLFGLTGFFPIWMLSMWITNPDSPIAVFLTIFPLTAPSVALLRMGFSDVPIWQLAAGFGLVTASLAGSTLLVARIFRAAMLVYGKPLRPRQIWQALRQA